MTETDVDGWIIVMFKVTAILLSLPILAGGICYTINGIYGVVRYFMNWRVSCKHKKAETEP